MINCVEKEQLCQISLTGVRSLALLGLLIQAPRSLEEIRKAFIEYNIMSDDNSNDIIRIDLNTLKSMGCEISRADHRTGNKYVLLNHPFKLDFEQGEIAVLKNAFNRLKENLEIDTLLHYDHLVKKLADNAISSDARETLIGLSPFKGCSASVLKTLKNACDNSKIVKVLYKPPAGKKEIKKEVAVQKLVLKNNKLYLYGYDVNKKESVTLNIKRILRILSQKDGEDSISEMDISVKFHLIDFGVSGLTEEESIESGNVKDGYIVNGKYHNDFVAMQRILSFGSKCTVLEPADFKNKIISIVKQMREIYNG